MKNPLRKRYLRELKEDLGKYIVIFLLLVLTIGAVSGFDIADESMLKTYQTSFEKYHIEDGNFITERKITASQRTLLEKNTVDIYDLTRYETSFTNDTTMRIFAKRTDINLECLMDGSFPIKDGEIAIDRMYAVNNDLSIGDTLEEENGKQYIITGLIALSDYSALFQNNNEIMFDSVKFGVAIVPQSTFDAYSDEMKTWNYAWKYKDPSIVGSDQEEDASQELLSQMRDVVSMESFIPRYQNQAITFTGEDIGGDGAMMVVFLYIVMVIIAFVFALTTRDMIQKESNVIGTLLASGYQVKELVRHYMFMPIMITLFSALIGNLLGYTVLKDYCASIYYGSYSLPTYKTIWNTNAFLKTTVVPCLIMAFITWIVLRKNLSFTPLKFLKHDFSRKKQKKAFHLNYKIPFFSRFRLRINLQNKSNYLILLIGIIFGNLLLMFGLALPDILKTYQDTIANHLIANYQTILSVPSNATDENHQLQSMMNFIKFSKAVETNQIDAEKFSAYTLNTIGSESVKTDEVMLYGIVEDSKYLKLPTQGIYVSYLYADKYDLHAGDQITLVEEYGDESYTFTIDGIIDYKGSISVFMPKKRLNQTFHLSDDFFAGYFSNEEITDIDQKYIGSVIDYDSLTKVSRQLTVSMGGMMYLVDGFCVVMFMILMYLLSKIVIEKNAQSISMTKILGYNDREISKLYVHSITIATIFCILISIPICSALLLKIYRLMLKEMMSGWLLIEVQPKIYIEMIILGLLSYFVVAIIEIQKIKKIPMDQALKNVE